jgi:hypothetical protein
VDLLAEASITGYFKILDRAFSLRSQKSGVAA